MRQLSRNTAVVSTGVIGPHVVCECRLSCVLLWLPSLRSDKSFPCVICGLAETAETSFVQKIGGDRLA